MKQSHLHKVTPDVIFTNCNNFPQTLDVIRQKLVTKTIAPSAAHTFGPLKVFRELLHKPFIDDEGVIELIQTTTIDQPITIDQDDIQKYVQDLGGKYDKTLFKRQKEASTTIFEEFFFDCKGVRSNG